MIRVRSVLALGLIASGALLVASSVRAGDATRSERLRALADRYAEDPDLDRARKELDAIGATASDLLAALREPAKPAQGMVGGERKVEIEDENGKKTELVIWAPPTEVLRARTKPVALAVLLHGLGGSASGARPFAERLIQRGDVVCVAPTATKLPASEMDWDDGIPNLVRTRFKHWWGYDDPHSLVLESVRKARELFWVDSERVTLAGVSMGGYGTWNVGLRWPDRWAALAPIAGGIGRFGALSDKDDYSLALLENGRNVPVYSAHGTKDPIVPFEPDREACQLLERIGGHVKFLSLDVGHTPDALKQAVEGPIFNEMLAFVAESRRVTSPADVTYVAVSEKQDGADWLRIVERTGASRPRLEGHVSQEGRLVTVTTVGCRKARVFLDERVLDGGRPIQVVANGRRVFEGKITASVEAVLESWRTRRDPGLVYAAAVDVGPAYR